MSIESSDKEEVPHPAQPGLGEAPPRRQRPRPVALAPISRCRRDPLHRSACGLDARREHGRGAAVVYRAIPTAVQLDMSTWTDWDARPRSRCKNSPASLATTSDTNQQQGFDGDARPTAGQLDMSTWTGWDARPCHGAKTSSKCTCRAPQQCPGSAQCRVSGWNCRQCVQGEYDAQRCTTMTLGIAV
jgi:hypothetical protein